MFNGLYKILHLAKTIFKNCPFTIYLITICLHAYQMVYTGSNEVIFLNYFVHINNYLAWLIVYYFLDMSKHKILIQTTFNILALWPCFESLWQEVCIFNVVSLFLFSE